jgi:dTDP-4-amino-4,6-dideoxygalactose transaminase
MLRPRRSPSVADLEKLYAEELGVPAAVLVPSARTGIYLALRAAACADAPVAAPAYTCEVVHDAVRLAGPPCSFLDSAPGQFLVSADDVLRAAPAACLVLSELYGIPYDTALLRATEAQPPRVRILDLAMSVARPECLARMGPRDVALFSFNMNKVMCAGGGGIACFRDDALAAATRQMRDRLPDPASSRRPLRADLGTVARTILRSRPLHNRLLEAAMRRRLARLRRAYVAAHLSSPIRAEEPENLSCEWTRRMTAFSRKIALYNLRRAGDSWHLRREQAQLYLVCLRDSGLVGGVNPEALPQSHFPIRVPAPLRDHLRGYLRRHGVAAGTTFDCPLGLERREFPGAFETSEEVLTLPMGACVDLQDVRAIARLVNAGFRELNIPETA